MTTTTVALRLDLAAWDEAKREFESDPHALTCAEVSAKYS